MMVIVAIMMPGMLAMGGLVMDGGMLYVETRKAQASADASALAGATYVWKHGTTDCSASGDACGVLNYASTMGYDNTSSTITIPHPAPSPYNTTNFASAGDFVQVNVQHNLTSFLIGIIFPGVTQVDVTSVAGVAHVPSEFAAIALGDPAGCTDIGLTGSVDLIITGGAVMSNCETANSISVGGSTVFQADEIQTAGACVGTTTPACETGMAQISDPLSGNLTTPCSTAATGSPCSSYTWGSSTNNDTVMDPGVWDTISVTGNMTVWMRSGIYVFKQSLSFGGGQALKVCDSSGAPAGGSPSGRGLVSSGYGCTGGTGGVLIFLASNEWDQTRADPCNNGVNPAPTFAGFDLRGGGGFDLRAKTSGPFAGLAVWGCSGNTATISLKGNASSQVQGTTYGPTMPLTLSGSAAWTTPSQVISKSLTANGSVAITVSYNHNLAYKPWGVVLIQ